MLVFAGVPETPWKTCAERLYRGVQPQGLFYGRQPLRELGNCVQWIMHLPGEEGLSHATH